MLKLSNEASGGESFTGTADTGKHRDPGKWHRQSKPESCPLALERRGRMSCEDQAITIMPKVCVHPLCAKAGKLLENRKGFMVCPNCGDSYGEAEGKMDEKVKKAEKAIWFWTKEYDGCYPPQFHHPVSDMEIVKKGWDYLLSLLEEKGREIDTLEKEVARLQEVF